MIVEEIMKTNVVTLKEDSSVGEALRLMREFKIRHLPIVNERNELQGIITAHDIRNGVPFELKYENNEQLLTLPVSTIMAKQPIIGHPLDLVEEVAMIFYEHRISCLPIVSGGQLVGIVTTTDVLYRYIELTGANKPSSKLDIRVTDKPGILHEVTAIFAAHHANVLSVLVYPDGEHLKKRVLSVRLQVINPLPIIQDLRQKGYDVLWPNLPGVEL